MADTYLHLDSTTGRVKEVAASTTSAGAADSGKIPALDTSGRLDATMMPVGITADVYTGNANGALSAGDLVYIRSDGTVSRASAASGGTPAVGFVLAASVDGASATVYFEGRNTALSGLTPGTRYYLSATTPGAVTATPVTGANKLHQRVGTAVTATSLAFEPEDVIVKAS